MNRGIRVLQTLALPLGYVTVYTLLYAILPKKSTLFLNFLKFFLRPFPDCGAPPPPVRETGGCLPPPANRRRACGGETKKFPTQRSFPSAGGKRSSVGNFEAGAGNEARTRYLHLGKVALYQMSYARIWCPEPESNQRHVDFQSTALPTELSGRMPRRAARQCPISRIWRPGTGSNRRPLA